MRSSRVPRPQRWVTHPSHLHPPHPFLRYPRTPLQNMVLMGHPSRPGCRRQPSASLHRQSSCCRPRRPARAPTSRSRRCTRRPAARPQARSGAGARPRARCGRWTSARRASCAGGARSASSGFRKGTRAGVARPISRRALTCLVPSNTKMGEAYACQRRCSRSRR